MIPRRTLAVAAGLAACLAPAAAAAPPGSTFLISRPDGVGPLTAPFVNHSSTLGFDTGAGTASARTASDDGRFVAFVSDADGLSDDDDDTVGNIFLRDRATGTTTLVSRASGLAGEAADGSSLEPAISPSGEWVAFTTFASNLSDADEGGARHVVARNVVTGETRLIDRATGAAGEIADSDSFEPSVTEVGGQPVVAFASLATNLGAADGVGHVYLRQGGTTAVVSRRDGDPSSPNALGNGASSSPSLARDASAVAFSSEATNLVDEGGGGDDDTNSVADVFLRVGATSETTLVSRGAVLGDAASGQPSVASIAGGHRVAFASRASTLDAVNDPGATDVYLRDVTGGVTSPVLVSRSGEGGAAGDDDSIEPSISADGGRVAFSSLAANLAPAGDGNGLSDVFVRTVAGGDTMLVSGPGATPSQGASGAPSISGDGGLVVFQSAGDDLEPLDDDDFQQVFSRDITPLPALDPLGWISRPTGVGGLRSGVHASFGRAPARDDEAVTSVSGDGRFVAFLSTSDDLSPLDDDRVTNVFVRDNQTGRTILASRADGPGGAAADGESGQGTGAPSLSADGRRVAFASRASNLVAGDANGAPDVFVRDIVDGTTILASRWTGGAPIAAASLDPAISGDGGRVAFQTAAPLAAADVNDDPDVYVRDLAASTTTIASVDSAGKVADAASTDPALDADGSHVGFTTAGALDPADGDVGDADVYVRDMGLGATLLASRRDGAAGAGGNGPSSDPVLSASGTRVAFTSGAANLVARGDVNGVVRDVFLRDLTAGTTTLVSRLTGAAGVSPDAASRQAAISADGTLVAFASLGSNLSADDTNGLGDVYLRDLPAGTTELASRADGAAGAAAGGANPALSANGACVAFDSNAGFAAPGLPGGSDFPRVLMRVVRGACPSVVPPPPAAGAAAVRVTAVANSAPRLTGLRLTPRRLRVLVRTRSGALRRAAPGRLVLTLSEPARLSLRIDALLPGRRVRGRCRPAARAGGRCVLAVRRGTLTRTGREGVNRLSLAPRLRGRALAAGAYRLTVTGVDAEGARSAPRRIVFTVLR